MIDKPEIDSCFGPQGPLAVEVPNFAPRQEQLHLAEAVTAAFADREVLIGEAGTGTGKTFAYLVPALLSGERVIISTGTRHLQDQLYVNDLPVVLNALINHGPDRAISHCLLKGRANYLCRHRLAKAAMNPAFRDQKNRQFLQILQEWSRRTETGDIAEVIGVPEDSILWSHITSSAEFCSEHEAEELSDCFVFKARQKAQQADIVVVNHHLLCADLALKEDGYGELLPSAQAFIIDEAHQLPEIATGFFGKKISSRQLDELARDTIADQLQEAPDMADLRDAAERLKDAVRHFRLAFGVDPSRDAWIAVRDNSRVTAELERLYIALDALLEHLKVADGRGKGLDSCCRRALLLKQLLLGFTQLIDSSKQSSADSNSGAQSDSDDGFAAEFIYWYETSRLGFSLNMTPMSVSRQFRQAMESLPASWVFTSATLAVGGDFSHFKARLGIEQSNELQVDSPFDYRNNALLYHPSNLPEPSAPTYTEQLLNACLPVLQASGGRAFVLFTSYRALNIAIEYFRAYPQFNVFSQGSLPKRELVEAFQSVENALLLGTSSFWEGVDVRGSALSCVIIDKLPFGSPGDPVMSARIDRMREEGGNPFFEFQLPQAAITLKQGVGRLIRDVSDRGVLVLCDPRIRSKAYGRVFIESLPPMPITEDLPEVQQFFSEQAEPDCLAVGSVAD